MKPALLVFAKGPKPGAVKTRMCPPWTPDQATGFYDALLGDVLEASAAAALRLGLVPYLCVTPPDAEAALAARAPEPFRTVVQRGEGLGARMGNAAADVGALGHAPLLIRGSDSPTLGEGALRAALDSLARADLALAPDQGGGYLLVALRHPVAGLFDHPMSTASVLEDTLARGRTRGLRTGLLAPGFDVDTVADLALLARARAGPEPLPCPRTLAWLDTQRLWPGSDRQAAEAAGRCRK